MINYKHFHRCTSVIIVLCILLSVIFAGCSGDNSSNQSQTTQPTATQAATVPQTESEADYAAKKAISGPYFAERAAVNGFGISNDKKDDENYKSHYSVYFGATDNGEFIEAQNSSEAAEMFKNTYEAIKANESNSDVVSITNIDKGHYKRYIQQQKDLYITIICLDNTYLFITSSIEQQPRYEVFLKDINY